MQVKVWVCLVRYILTTEVSNTKERLFFLIYSCKHCSSITLQIKVSLIANHINQVRKRRVKAKNKKNWPSYMRLNL